MTDIVRDTTGRTTLTEQYVEIDYNDIDAEGLMWGRDRNNGVRFGGLVWCWAEGDGTRVPGRIEAWRAGRNDREERGVS